MRYLTLDLGTTYLKAALFEEHRLLQVVREPLQVMHPQPDFWELPGLSFEQHVSRVLEKLRDVSGGFAGVKAMSFASQTNSHRLLDHHDQPLTPLMLWPDARAASISPQLSTLMARVNFTADTGLPQADGHFLLGRLYHRSLTTGWKGVARCSLISDELTRWFTGEFVSEASVMGLTGLLNINTLQKLDTLLEHAGIPPNILPNVVRAGTDLGPIRVTVAEQFGLPRDCRFVVGCLDQYAGALGAGNVNAGTLSETTGTVLCTVRCIDPQQDQLPPQVFRGPGLHTRHGYGFLFSPHGAGLLEQYRQSLPDPLSFAQLDELAGMVAAGADGLSVDVSIHAQRPQLIFKAKQQAAHSTGHHVRAILEGVANTLAEHVAVLDPQHQCELIRSCGGAARSQLWRQIKADITQRKIASPVCEEPTSLGAAMLAAAALHRTSAIELAQSWITLGPICEPHQP